MLRFLNARYSLADKRCAFVGVWQATWSNSRQHIDWRKSSLQSRKVSMIHQKSSQVK